MTDKFVLAVAAQAGVPKTGGQLNAGLRETAATPDAVTGAAAKLPAQTW